LNRIETCKHELNQKIDDYCALAYIIWGEKKVCLLTIILKSTFSINFRLISKGLDKMLGFRVSFLTIIEFALWFNDVALSIKFGHKFPFSFEFPE
jgi:hypothetical protein